MDMTARLKLPLLSVAQAAKEMTVNEALTVADIAVQPVVEAMVDSPPTTPAAGQSWLVGATPDGPFAGHSGAIAAWTAGGWRFVEPFEGMAVWRRDEGTVARHRVGAWLGGAPVSGPTGGTTVDTEARAAIAAILARLRDGGMIAA